MRIGRSGSFGGSAGAGGAGAASTGCAAGAFGAVAFAVAAHAEAAIALEGALAIEDRQAGELDAHRAARAGPREHDAAEGVARRDRVCETAFGIEAELSCDLAPRLADRLGGARPHRVGEGRRREVEALVRIHGPHEAQRTLGGRGGGDFLGSVLGLGARIAPRRCSAQAAPRSLCEDGISSAASFHFLGLLGRLLRASLRPFMRQQHKQHGVAAAAEPLGVHTESSPASCRVQDRCSCRATPLLPRTPPEVRCSRRTTWLHARQAAALCGPAPKPSPGCRRRRRSRRARRHTPDSNRYRAAARISATSAEAFRASRARSAPSGSSLVKIRSVERDDARRVQRNRARRIRPEHAAPIRREEPRRDRAHRVRREACVAGECEDVRSRHGHFFGFACALQQRKQTLNRALLLPRPRAIHRDRRIALTGNLTRPTCVCF